MDSDPDRRRSADCGFKKNTSSNASGMIQGPNRNEFLEGKLIWYCLIVPREQNFCKDP
jgi:hypothetical protein